MFSRPDVMVALKSSESYGLFCCCPWHYLTSYHDRIRAQEDVDRVDGDCRAAWLGELGCWVNHLRVASVVLGLRQQCEEYFRTESGRQYKFRVYVGRVMTRFVTARLPDPATKDNTQCNLRHLQAL